MSNLPTRLQRPGYGKPADDPSLDFWVKNRPDMLHTYAQTQLTGLLDCGIPKTRYLLLVGLYMMNGHWEGVLPQTCNAKAAGATDEELMEVAFCVCCSVGKAKLHEERRLPRQGLREPHVQGDLAAGGVVAAE